MPSDVLDAQEITVPTGWDCIPLETIADQERGISYGIVQPGKHDSTGVPVLRVNNLRDGRILTDDVLRVSEEVEANYSRTRLQGGELLLSLVGTLGEVAVVPEELAGWNVARAVAVIPVKKDIDPHWLAMCLRSAGVQNLIRAWATTTVQATFNLRDVRRLPILLAPEPDRSNITRAVKQVVDKIEQNRRTAGKLEELALAVFRAWFVDFAPVHAKAGGATTYPGLPQQAFDDLPATFTPGTDSPLGPIPEGWEIGPISKLAALSKEQVKPQENPDEVFDHFSLPAFDAGKEPVREVGAGIKSGKFLVPDGCVMISKLNPRIPRIWLPEIREEVRPIASTEFIILKPATKPNRSFLFGLLNQGAFMNELTGQASGTSNSHQRLQPKAFMATDVVLPPAELINRYDQVIAPMLDLVQQGRDESRKLAELRDYLLPRLLSGAVRVREPKAIAEGVA